MDFLYTFVLFAFASGVVLENELEHHLHNATQEGDILTLGNGQTINCASYGAVVSLKFPCGFAGRRDGKWFSGGSHRSSMNVAGLDILQDGFHFNNVFREYPYDISPAKLPQASIEIRFRVVSKLNDLSWIVGHDNGGYDRAINIFDKRFGGIAQPIGGTYKSKIPYPKLNTWYHVVATFHNGKRTWLYVLGDGGLIRQQIKANNGGGLPSFSVGGLKTYGGHTVNAVISTVRVFNKVLTPAEVDNLFDNAV